MTSAERLIGGRIAVIGVGGIGGPAALALVRGGVRRLTLCDPDVVSDDNLPRQILFEDEDIGKLKVEAARARLRLACPDAEIEVRAVRFTEAGGPAGAMAAPVGGGARSCAIGSTPAAARSSSPASVGRWLAGFEVVLDGTDDLAGKLELHAAAVRAGVAIAVGAAHRMEGHTVFVPPGGRPCYRCFFGDPPPTGPGLTCAEAGVWPTLPGFIGALLSRQVIEYLRRGAEGLAGRLIKVEAAGRRVRGIPFGSDPECSVCGPGGDKE